MSKRTTSKPSYTNSTYQINGQTKASNVKVGDMVYSNYNMTPDERAIYEYAQKTLSQILPQVNTFSPETQKNLQAQLNAYQNQGANSINNLYTPILNNLKTDIASRFGNLDNSMFLDKLSNIENSRKNAMAQLAESLISKRNELVNDELSNRYNLVNLLNSIQNQYNTNAMNTVSTAVNAGTTANVSTPIKSQSSGIDLNSILALASILMV